MSKKFQITTSTCTLQCPIRTLILFNIRIQSKSPKPCAAKDTPPAVPNDFAAIMGQKPPASIWEFFKRILIDSPIHMHPIIPCESLHICWTPMGNPYVEKVPYKVWDRRIWGSRSLWTSDLGRAGGSLSLAKRGPIFW